MGAARCGAFRLGAGVAVIPSMKNKIPIPKPRWNSEAGRIGYIIAWLMGVPASLLLLIFLIRGH